MVARRSPSTAEDPATVFALIDAKADEAGFYAPTTAARRGRALQDGRAAASGAAARARPQRGQAARLARRRQRARAPLSGWSSGGALRPEPRLAPDRGLVSRRRAANHRFSSTREAGHELVDERERRAQHRRGKRGARRAGAHRRARRSHEPSGPSDRTTRLGNDGGSTSRTTTARRGATSPTCGDAVLPRLDDNEAVLQRVRRDQDNWSHCGPSRSLNRWGVDERLVHRRRRRLPDEKPNDRPYLRPRRRNVSRFDTKTAVRRSARPVRGARAAVTMRWAAARSRRAQAGAGRRRAASVAAGRAGGAAATGNDRTNWDAPTSSSALRRRVSTGRQPALSHDDRATMGA